MPYLKGRVLDVGCGTGSLAGLVEAELYLGVDRDAGSITEARAAFPKHDFSGQMPPRDEKFDTVVALAVIEHVSDPAAFLQDLASHLAASPGARIVCTTPHPAVGWLHDAGAALGVFSKHASHEHEDLLDYSRLQSAGFKAGLNLLKYKRFLVGANQLAVFQPGVERP